MLAWQAVKIEMRSMLRPEAIWVRCTAFDSSKMGPVDMNIGFEYARFVFGDAFTDQTGTAPSSINASRIYVRSAL